MGFLPLSLVWTIATATFCSQSCWSVGCTCLISPFLTRMTTPSPRAPSFFGLVVMSDMPFSRAMSSKLAMLTASNQVSCRHRRSRFFSAILEITRACFAAWRRPRTFHVPIFSLVYYMVGLLLPALSSIGASVPDEDLWFPD